MHPALWGDFTWRITGKNAKGEVTLDGGWQNNRGGAVHPSIRFVENVFEELDAPGEWFLDRQCLRREGMSFDATLSGANTFRLSCIVRPGVLTSTTISCIWTALPALHPRSDFKSRAAGMRTPLWQMRSLSIQGREITA